MSDNRIKPVLLGEDYNAGPTENAIQVPSTLYLTGLLLFYGTLAFDFKSVAYGGNPIEIRAAIVSLSVLGFFIAFLSRGPVKIVHQDYPMMNLILRIWIFYPIYLTFITFFRSETLTSTIYLGAPFYFMIMSMTLAYRHIEANYKHDDFWRIFIFMAVVSALWTLYLGRSTSLSFDDGNFAFIEDVRYEIVSSTCTVLIAIGFMNYSRGKNIFTSLLFIFLTGSIYAISKTRGLLPGVVSLIIFAILVHERRISSAIRILFVTIAAFGIAIIIPLYVRNFDLLDVWRTRLFEVDGKFNDLTLNMRLAEYVAQFRLLLSDYQSGLFGFGYVKTIFWDAQIWDMINFDQDVSEYYSTGGVGLHSTWINSLFHGGFLFGMIPFLTITYVVIIAVRLVFLTSAERAQFGRYGIIACAAIVTIWLPANFGSLFGDRLGPVTIAPSMMFAIYEWERFNRSKRMKKVKEATGEPTIFKTFPVTASVN